MAANNPPSLERLTMMWGPAVTSETRSTQTIHRKPKKEEFARTLRTARKVVLPSRAVALGGGMPPDYELMDKLGEGGMGVVYVARQTSIDRTIAIKMLKPDVAQDDDVRSRFLAEAAVTGALDHPNIVPIYDLGANEAGALFYAMKRVRGTPWNDVLASKNLEENLEVWARTADAVAFAHSRGIIHRDLKPENVMLGDFGEVLVMDWGLALSVGLGGKSGQMDQSDSMAGTPAYMAPEMASGESTSIGFCSDIYLLGAILYEIVTGIPPHTGKNVMGCLFNAACNKIEKTEKKGELVDIALKAMATAPKDRYASVADLRAEVKLYLSHLESIRLSDKAAGQLERALQTNVYNDFAQAVFGFREAAEFWDRNRDAEVGVSKASLAYAQCAFKRGDLDLSTSLLDPEDPTHVEALLQVQTEQIERRNREIRFERLKQAAVVLAGAVFLVVAVAFVWVSRERNVAVEAKDQAIRSEAKAVAQTRVAEKEKLEADVARKAAEEAERAAKQAKAQEEVQKQAALANEKSAVEAKKLAEDEKKKAEDEKLRAEAAQKQADYDAYIAQVGLAASKVEENSFRHAFTLLDQSKPDQRNWEWGRLKYLCNREDKTLSGHRQRVDAVCYSPDGRLLVTASWDETARVWDVETGRMLLELKEPVHHSYVHAAAFSHDGARIATADFNGRIAVWNSKDGSLVKTWDGHSKAVYSVDFTKDGRNLLTSSADYTAKLWLNWESPQPDVRLFAKKLGQPAGDGQPAVEGHEGHNGWVWCAAFSPNESRIVTTAQDGAAIVWRTADARPQVIFRGHEAPVYSACFVDEDRVVSGGEDRVARLWEAAEDKAPVAETLVKKEPKAREGKPLHVYPGHTGAVRSTVVSRDGSWLLTAGNDNTARIWNLYDGASVRVFRGHSGWVAAACFSPDERFVATASHDADVKLWDVQNYRESIPLVGHAKDVLTCAFDPGGEFVMTGGLDRVVKLWDLRTGQEVRTFDEGHSARVNKALFSPDGRYVLTISEDMTAILWDRVHGGEVHRFRDHIGSINAAVFSKDGSHLVTAGRDQAVRMWRMSDFSAVVKLDELKSEVLSVAVSDDSRRIMVGFDSGRVKVFDRSGAVLANVDVHTKGVYGVAFAADGKHGVSVSADRTGAFWDLTTGREDVPTLEHPSSATALAVAPGGRIYATGDEGRKVRIWDASTRKLLKTLEGHTGAIRELAFSSDGAELASVGADHVLRIWNVAEGRTEKVYVGRRAGTIGTQLPLQTITSVAFSEDGRQLLVGGDAEAFLWSRDEDRELQSYARHNEVSALAIFAAKRWLATSGSDRVIKLWNLETNQVFRKFLDGHEASINGLAFSPDARWMVSVGNDKRIVVWDVEAQKKVREFTKHDARIASVAFSPDGEWVVTASYDNTAKVWSPKTGEERCTLQGHTSFVLSALFSPKGDSIVTGSADNTARVWDAKTGKPRLEKPLAGHTAYVKFASFSQDGSRILTGSEDTTARLWDAKTGQEILTLKGHARELTWVGFAPHDPQLVMTASRDAKAILWPAVDWVAPAAAAEAEKKVAGPVLKTLPAFPPPAPSE